ncbi:MAG: YggS family pyridoxal phosphate-dependent enzyme [Planctomycetota bacterium]
MASSPADSTLDERYRSVLERVANAEARAGRPKGAVHTIAVTKYAEMDDVLRLIELGHRDFGENRVQQLTQRAAHIDELMNRRATLTKASVETGGSGAPPEPVRWHLIGHLQRNKAKPAAEVTRLIHSVDSLRLAEELQAIGLKREHPIELLVQVNCSGEDQKYGCNVSATQALCEAIDGMSALRVRGLMTMAAYSDEPEDARQTFARCREIYDDITRLELNEGRFNILSMGMSGDFEVAIEEGANLVRVGSAIFGERPPASDDDSDEED